MRHSFSCFYIEIAYSNLTFCGATRSVFWLTTQVQQNEHTPAQNYFGATDSPVWTLNGLNCYYFHLWVIVIRCNHIRVIGRAQLDPRVTWFSFIAHPHWQLIDNWISLCAKFELHKTIMILKRRMRMRIKCMFVHTSKSSHFHFVRSFKVLRRLHASDTNAVNCRSSFFLILLILDESFDVGTVSVDVRVSDA